MKTFRILISFALFFNLLNFSYANSLTCSSLGNRLSGTEPDSTEPVYLGKFVPFNDGMTVWNRYVCRQCSEIDPDRVTVVNARPNKDGIQMCQGCGKPHTNETYFKGARIEKDGVVYVLESDVVLDGPPNKQDITFKYTQDLRWHCPYCEVSNSVKENCVQCGASASGLKLFSDLLNGVPENHNNHRARILKPGEDPASLLAQENETQLPGGYVLNPKSVDPASAKKAKLAFGKSIPYEYVKEKVAEFGKILKTHYRIIGVSVAAIVVMNTIYYLKAAHVYPGKITSVAASSITISYGSETSKKEIVVTTANKLKPARIGEDVSVHTTKASGVLAVERDSNGEVLLPSDSR